MVKWYVIGYLVIGLILDVIYRTYEALHPDPFHEPGSLGYLFFFAWPICLIGLSIERSSKVIDTLAKYIALKIKEKEQRQINNERKDC